MRVIPKPLAEMLVWFQGRASAWTGNAGAIGLTESTAQAVADAAQAMAQAKREAELAREAAKAAGQRYRQAARTLRRVGTGAAQQIRGFAQSRPTEADRAAVYTLALLPEPRGAGVVAQPGTPTEFRVGLLQDGAITLAWDCDNDGGTHVSYQVRRAVDGDIDAGRFEHLETVGERALVDRTLPAGVSRVEYAVRAVRKARGGSRGADGQGRGRGAGLVRGKEARFPILIGSLRASGASDGGTGGGIGQDADAA